ncbi:MAG: inorganic phosphate transporter [Firmicutes bacterium]|nr:inorganic phosphate transporter [Bacillota bacterium]
MLSTILLCVIIAALVFEFINGFHDTACAIATSVYTRALTPRNAILLAAAMNLIGALMGEKVAKTISSGLVDIQLEQYVILAALIAAIIWDLITWYFGIPSSSSPALIGGLVGATIGYCMSFEHIIWTGVLNKVVIPLFCSPVVGFLLGFLVMKVIFNFLANRPNNKVNKVFSKLQIFSAALVAYSHGNNDAQKTMGIITLALITGGFLGADADVPLWVKIICACTMATGTAVGGWKVMKTMGGSVTKLTPANGFAAQATAAAVIECASFIGAPVSTTQVITTSIMGAGTAKRLRAVKWNTAGNIAIAWVITLPITIALGAGCSLLLGLVM